MGIPAVQRYEKYLTIDCSGRQVAIELLGTAFAAAVKQLNEANFHLPINSEEIRGNYMRVVFNEAVDSQTLLWHLTTLTPAQFDSLYETGSVSDGAH